jgi:hypothetical protein
MSDFDWHKCRVLESSENLKPLVKERFGREPSASIAREITACLQQGRLFYEVAASSPLEIRPLQLFYGMVGFSKALVVARHLCPLSTLRHAHGLKDISPGNSRIADLRLRIEQAGTFQEVNDVVAELTRLCYIDNSTKWRTISLPSAKSDQLHGMELSLREILSRVPHLESLYRMTFGEDAQTDSIGFGTGRDDQDFYIRIDDPDLFSDRASLKQIVNRWRARFPFLKMWRLDSAEHAWGKSMLHFRNTHKPDIDEFSEAHLHPQNGGFQASARTGDPNERFPPEEGLHPIAGGYPGEGLYPISPVSDYYLSEFSFQYLALFLLSSLMRYRPQTWTHAISRSVSSGEPADDKALSLIERFLDLNGGFIPQVVVTVLNPHEDLYR